MEKWNEIEEKKNSKWGKRIDIKKTNMNMLMENKSLRDSFLLYLWDDGCYNENNLKN